MSVLGRIVLGVVVAVILLMVGSGVAWIVTRSDNSGPIHPTIPVVSTTP